MDAVTPEPLDAALAADLAALDAAGLRRACRECDGPTGPRACILPVEMPTSAPKP